MNIDTNAKKYDLEERTAVFGKNIIIFCKETPETSITRPLINQIVRSGTSIGANYMEANGASSRKDFRNKIYICKKEAQETKHWLKMFEACIPEKNVRIEPLVKEVQELIMIFQKIVSSIDH